MSESLDAVAGVERRDPSSVCADLGDATQEILTAVEMDRLAATTPSTATTDGAEGRLERAEEETALLDADLGASLEAQLEDKYANVELLETAVTGSRAGHSFLAVKNEEEENVIIAPLTASALNQQNARIGVEKTSTANKRAQKRPRKAAEAPKTEDPAELAFRQSQKTLRKEASKMSLKEVLGRSLTLTMDSQNSNGGGAGAGSFPCSPPTMHASALAANGSFASPTTPPSASPTAWSPLLSGSITSRFLANVEQQRKQTVERVVSKQMGRRGGFGSHATTTPGSGVHGDGGASQSQSVFSPSSPVPATGSASFPHSLPDILDDELVIGDEDANDLNWMPVTPTSDYSGRFARAIHAVDDASEASRSVMHGTQSIAELASGAAQSMTESLDTPAEQERRRRREAEQKRSEDEANQALSRKHEMWKLKQRHLRAQRLVEQDAKATQKQNGTAGPARGGGSTATTTAAATAASSSAITGHDSPAKDSPEFFRRVLNATLTPSASQAGEPDGDGLSQGLASGSTTSIAQSKLSVQDISMIKRLNSYDNTASQSVMVFATSSSSSTITTTAASNAGASAPAKKTV